MKTTAEILLVGLKTSWTHRRPSEAQNANRLRPQHRAALGLLLPFSLSSVCPHEKTASRANAVTLTRGLGQTCSMHLAEGAPIVPLLYSYQTAFQRESVSLEHGYATRRCFVLGTFYASARHFSTLHAQDAKRTICASCIVGVGIAARRPLPVLLDAQVKTSLRRFDFASYKPTRGPQTAQVFLLPFSLLSG